MRKVKGLILQKSSIAGNYLRIRYMRGYGPDGRIEIKLDQDSKACEYAILSHRWGKPRDEVTFEDMLTGPHIFRHKVGYAKLERCCRQAHQDGHKRVWSDTCCINKSSSAELSEAIISMYSYYENSQVCYAYLDDVGKRAEPRMKGGRVRDNPISVSESAWFKRGWTLQELIAPDTVKFFDSSWKLLGKKTDVQISKEIEKASGIGSSILEDPKLIRAVSIANRMSWAAQRKTARIEDRAYSLMGIFGVYMSPIYGEGHNAFIRLQEEIMRTSHDHTLFAWTFPPPGEIWQRNTFENVSTMLALSPDQFEQSSEFIHRPYNSFSNKFDPERARLDYTTTNAGLSINLPIVQVDKEQQLYAAILACTEGNSPVPSAILLHTTTGTPRGYFWRANTDAGPIERNGEFWFQALGRDTLRLTTVYILPKLTSVSQDLIEPHWFPLEYQELEGGASLGPRSSDDTTVPAITFKPERTLVQAKDPCFEELVLLSAARRKLYGQAVHLSGEEFQHQRMFPKDFEWRSRGRFFGRSAEIQRMKKLFENPRPAIVLISGIGNIGKSELAREFAYRCRDGDLFSSIVWINASTSSTIHQGFRQVARNAGIKHTKDDKLSELSSRVLRWLDYLSRFIFYTKGGSNSVQWLLILDNAQNSLDLEDVWKPHVDAGTVRILVTSRNSTFGGDLGTETTVRGPRTIFLGPLNNGDANQMLQSLTHTNEDFSGVVACWDGTPLTIGHVSNLAPEKQLHHHSNARRGSRLIYKHNSMALSESLKQQFDELHPSSFALLSIISFFDASSMSPGIFIPRRLLTLEKYPQNGDDVSTYLHHLKRSSLIMQRSQKGSLKILRLVQNEVRDRLAPDTYKKALATAISLLYDAWFPRGLELDQRQWISKNLFPHLLRLETLAEGFTDSETDFSTREMLDQLVQSSEKLQLVGDFVGHKSGTTETENER
ncbi:hypothetical protein G7054_g13271 [Neopestalotiopsis clavispora]|nr:hypothetical protein G7054_g13271 [Neopestalotiopsis clavispora]